MAAKTVNVVRDMRTNCFLLTLQNIRELLRLGKRRKKLHLKQKTVDQWMNIRNDVSVDK